MRKLKAFIREWLEVPHLPLIKEDQASLREAQIELDDRITNLATNQQTISKRLEMFKANVNNKLRS